MTGPRNIFQGLASNRRIKRRRAVISSGDGNDLELYNEEILERTPEGDFISVETINSVLLPDGQKVTSHIQIQGRCVECSNYVTVKSGRYCLCGKTICLSCGKYWKPENRTVCKSCYRKLRRGQLLSAALHLIISPFIKEQQQ